MRSVFTVFLLRLFSAAFVLLSLPPAFAQVTVVQDDRTQVTTFRMLVSPAAEPEPAFKYRLLKHENARKDGNAATFYYRAQIDLRTVSQGVRKEFGEEYDRWYSTDVLLGDLPKEKVRKALSRFGSIMKELREATSRTYCDWGWDIHKVRGPEVFSFRLAEVQESRALARMLALQIRLALAEDRLDDAVEYLQMNYQIARDISSPPFLVCGLVGVSISTISNEHTLELIAAPGAPNLYWALAELPRPLIDLRPAARFELGIGPRVFPLLQDADARSRTAEQWARDVGDAYRGLLNNLGSPSNNSLMAAGFSAEAQDLLKPEVVAHLIGVGWGLVGYTTAKQALIKSGFSAEKVESMPVGHVLALQASRAYQHTADAFEKLWCMPFAEAMNRYQEIQNNLERDGYLGGKVQSKEVIPIASLLMPAVHAARGAQERLARELAAMQVIEALRMHAAETDGFPATLADVRIVPVPLNPATGSPFAYRRKFRHKGEVAILELPESDGFPGYHRRFEITLRQP